MRELRYIDLDKIILCFTIKRKWWFGKKWYVIMHNAYGEKIVHRVSKQNYKAIVQAMHNLGMARDF